SCARVSVWPIAVSFREKRTRAACPHAAREKPCDCTTGLPGWMGSITRGQRVASARCSDVPERDDGPARGAQPHASSLLNIMAGTANQTPSQSRRLIALGKEPSEQCLEIGPEGESRDTN